MPLPPRHFRWFAFVFGLPAQAPARDGKIPAAAHKPHETKKPRGDDRRKGSR